MKQQSEALIAHNLRQVLELKETMAIKHRWIGETDSRWSQSITTSTDFVADRIMMNLENNYHNL